MSTEAETLAPPDPPATPPVVLRSRIALPKPDSFGSYLPAFPAQPLLDAPKPNTRMLLWVGLFISVVFCGGFLVWSIFAPLAEAAIAPGSIKVEGTRRTIQHLEGGIIREILVRDGAHVEAGQVLVRLDDIQADTTLETVRGQRWGLLAQEARLLAEIAGRDHVDFPQELLDSVDPRAQGAVLGQRGLFEARAANLNGQTLVLRARIEQQDAVTAGARGQLAATQRQLSLIRQEEGMRRGLVEQGLSRLPELLAVQRTRAGLEGQVEDLSGQIERAQASIGEARRQIEQATSQRLQEANTDLGDIRGRLGEANEKLRAANDVMVRREITAPEAGTIVNLRLFTIGAVARPGDPLMELVPEHDRLVAEVNVAPTDIDVVYPGLQAEVRLPAFKQRLVPYLHGVVTWVAADVTTNEQTHQSFYRAYILIDQEQLAQLPNVFLTPGMPVEGHIKIGERSFFRYLTQPVRDSFHRAFREQ